MYWNSCSNREAYLEICQISLMELSAKVILTKGYIKNIGKGSNVLLSIITDNYKETKQYIAKLTNSERDSKNSDVSEGNSF